mmetsp:Transcript_49148/g.111465  ORF Transcript_49148/g.111465 Transcript_49148/m.111465 type:complete len:367 (-) Transcript_49148:289-1389(-)
MKLAGPPLDRRVKPPVKFPRRPKVERSCRVVRGKGRAEMKGPQKRIAIHLGKPDGVWKSVEEEAQHGEGLPLCLSLRIRCEPNRIFSSSGAAAAGESSRAPPGASPLSDRRPHDESHLDPGGPLRAHSLVRFDQLRVSCAQNDRRPKASRSAPPGPGHGERLLEPIQGHPHHHARKEDPPRAPRLSSAPRLGGGLGGGQSRGQLEPGCPACGPTAFSCRGFRGLKSGASVGGVAVADLGVKDLSGELGPARVEELEGVRCGTPQVGTRLGWPEGHREGLGEHQGPAGVLTKPRPPKVEPFEAPIIAKGPVEHVPGQGCDRVGVVLGEGAEELPHPEGVHPEGVRHPRGRLRALRAATTAGAGWAVG